MREGSVYAVLAKFKVPVALCSALCCPVIDDLPPGNRAPFSTPLLLALLPPIPHCCCCSTFFRCTDFPPDSFHASLCFKQCSLSTVYSLFLILSTPLGPAAPPTVPNQLSAKYNKLRLLCFGKIMFTLVLSAKSINAIDLKALLSFCCFILLFSFCCCHLLKRFWSAL